MALLAALARLREPRLRIRAVHVDHGLHPGSRRWSAHCRAFAARLGLPLKVLRTRVSRVRGQSLEALARAARYELLAGELAPGEILLTAHHEDDQLETVLLQLFRGCGLPGIAAMPEVAAFAGGTLARPLLTASRARLLAWVTSCGLEWVEDDTNADERLDRNYLRRRVVPLLRERWPGIAKTVARSARHAAQAQQLLEASGRRDAARAADGGRLLLGPLRALPPGRRRNAVRTWIAASGFPLPDTRRLEEICFPLLAARSDAHPRVAWNGVVVQRDSQHLTLGSAARATTRGSCRSHSRRTWPERWLLIIAGLALMYPKPFLDYVGIALIVVAVVIHKLRRGKIHAAA